jgi:hypothetical protein
MDLGHHFLQLSLGHAFCKRKKHIYSTVTVKTKEKWPDKTCDRLFKISRSGLSVLFHDDLYITVTKRYMQVIGNTSLSTMLWCFRKELQFINTSINNFYEIMMMHVLYLTYKLSWILIVIAPIRHIILTLSQSFFILTPQICVLIREAATANFVVPGLTRSGINTIGWMDTQREA